MNNIKVEVLKGGQNDPEKEIEQYILEHSVIDEENMTLKMTVPHEEYFDFCVSKWTEQTKKLSDEDIKQICDFYKHKWVEIEFAGKEAENEPTSYQICYVDSVRLDKETGRFAIYSNTVIESKDGESFDPVVVTNLVLGVPFNQNDRLIDGDIVVDDEDVVELLKYSLHQINSAKNRYTQLLNLLEPQQKQDKKPNNKNKK